MKYFFAIVFPPVAVLMCGKPFSALLNFALWLCFILPGILHGCLVVHQYNASRYSIASRRAMR